jgi:hypothetical protein
MTFDEWSDTLLIKALEREEATGKPEVDPKGRCLEFELLANENWLSRFLKEQAKFGQGSTAGVYSFSLDSNVLYLANSIREKRMSKTFLGRIRLIIRSDWLAPGAFIISLAALFK